MQKKNFRVTNSTKQHLLNLLKRFCLHVLPACPHWKTKGVFETYSEPLIIFSNYFMPLVVQQLHTTAFSYKSPAIGIPSVGFIFNTPRETLFLLALLNALGSIQISIKALNEP